MPARLIPMTAKTATVRLYVGLVSLVSGVLSLVTALIGLVAASIRRATRALESSREPSEASGKSLEAPAKGLRLVRPIETAQAMLTQEDRLTTALVGMGFSSKDVRRYVASLGTRAASEDLKVLIVEGLRFLAPGAKVAS